MIKDKIITRLAEFKIRLDRGNALIYWVKNLVIIVAGFKYILNLDLFLTLIAGLITAILMYLLGWLDLDFIKLYQKEAQISTGKYNPYFKRLKKRFK